MDTRQGLAPCITGLQPARFARSVARDYGSTIRTCTGLSPIPTGCVAAYALAESFKIGEPNRFCPGSASVTARNATITSWAP